MIIKGQEAIAELFSVTAKTIGLWQEEGFPVAKQGGPHVPSLYDGAACVSWLLNREIGKIRTESPKDRLNRLQADKIEMELSEKRAELVPVSAIEPRLRAAVVAARNSLRDSPGRLARAVHGLPVRETEDVLADELDQFLRKLAHGLMQAAGASAQTGADSSGTPSRSNSADDE